LVFSEKLGMAKPLVSDELWYLIEPLLPVKPRRIRFPGRKPLNNRAALTGILFVLKTGIGWEDLPKEMGCGSGMTCWRRLRDWQQAGVWSKLHGILRIVSTARARSIGAVPWWTAVRCVLFLGAPDGAKSDGSRPSSKKAPHLDRCPRGPAECDSRRCKCSRFHPDVRADRSNPLRFEVDPAGLAVDLIERKVIEPRAVALILAGCVSAT
jgi:transposase